MKNRYAAPLLTLGLASLLCSCHKKEESQGFGIPDIDVAEAFTDSVVLYKTYPGFLESGSNAKVVCQVNGRLLAKHYESGTPVKKGQLLFTIDPTIYADAAAQAEGNYQSAVSACDYAKSHYEAVKKAAESDAVSKMEVLSAESSWEQAKAQVRTTAAALNTARTRLGYCRITAPIDGIISDGTIGDGNYITGEGSPFVMATIYENSKLNAVFEIEDAQYERMVGRTSGINDPIYRHMPLTFRDSLIHEYYADLVYEAPDVNKSTGTILLKGKVENVGKELKNGMYVTVSLPYGRNPRAVLIKDASIGTDQLGRYVYLVNDSNRVVYTPIEVGGLYRDSLRIVNKGIAPGDRYVSKALLTVRNGEHINPVPKQ